MALAWHPQLEIELSVCKREGRSHQELRTSVNTVGLQRSGRVSLLMLGLLKFSVPQFPPLQGEAVDPQPLYLVEGRGSAIEEEEASAFLALGWGGHCQPPKLNFSTGLWRVGRRSQLGYRVGRVQGRS